MVGPTLRVSDSVGLRCNPRICISDKFQDDVNDVGLVATLWEPLVNTNFVVGIVTPLCEQRNKQSPCVLEILCNNS